MAVAVAHLVSVEFGMRMFNGMFSTLRHGSVVAVLDVVVIIYVSVKVRRTVEPWTGTDENTTGKPLRPVIAVWSTGIWSVIVVSVWAYWRRSYRDRDLRVRLRGSCEE